MDDQVETTIEESIVDDAVAEIPEEVQDFLWSDAFSLIVSGIRNALSLTEEQGKLLKSNAEDILLGIKTMEDAFQTLHDAGVNDDLAVKILYAIDQEIITRAENIDEFFDEDSNESDDISSIDQQKQAPSPSDVLESLKSSLTQSKSIAPTSRSYDIAKPTSSESSPNAPISSDTIDPYREIPGK